MVFLIERLSFIELLKAVTWSCYCCCYCLSSPLCARFVGFSPSFRHFHFIIPFSLLDHYIMCHISLLQDWKGGAVYWNGHLYPGKSSEGQKILTSHCGLVALPLGKLRRDIWLHFLWTTSLLRVSSQGVFLHTFV